MSLTESKKLANDPPTERGWYWVQTDPAWETPPEAVFVCYPDYDDRLHVFTVGIIDSVTTLEYFCNRFPRRWLGKIEYPKYKQYGNIGNN